MRTPFILLVLFQLKHFLADYPFQTNWMRLKGERDKWLFPMLFHSAMHGAFTFGLVSLLQIHFTLVYPFTLAAICALIDFVTHVIIDTGKAKLEQVVVPKLHPWVLGLDQMSHHLVNIALVVYMMGWIIYTGDM